MAQYYRFLTNCRDLQLGGLSKMKHRKKIIALAVITILAVIIFSLRWYSNSPQHQARQLLAELGRLDQPPGRFTEFLIELGWLEEEQQRDTQEIVEDFVKLGEPAVSILIPALKDEDGLVQIMVARALGRIGPPADSAIPALIEVLNTEQDFEFLNEAALALGRMGVEAVPYLIEVKKNKDIKKRMFAVMALVGIDKDFADDENVSFLIKILDNENSEFRERATWALGEIGPGAQKAVPSLIRAWHDPDNKVSQNSLDAIVKIGKPAVVQLVQALEDENKIVRFFAASAMTDIDPNLAARHITDVLRSLLNDPDKNWRQSALRLLVNMGPEARPALPILRQALKDQDDVVRLYAVRALNNINISTPEVISALLAAIHDKDTDIRTSAIRALGKKKIASPKVIGALIRALNDPEYMVRIYAAYALGLFKPPDQEVLPALGYALNDPHYQVRFTAALSLFKIASDADTRQEALALLIDALNHQDEEVSRSACFRLMQIGPDARQAVPALKKKLKAKGIVLRINAASALAKIDPAHQGQQALKIITKALNSKYYGVRLEAVFALSQIGLVSDEVVPSLVGVLKDRDNDVRRYAIEALGEIGPAAQPALGALKEALHDRDEKVRRAAAEALKKIEGGNKDGR